jgi:hypothetical protein
MSLQSPSSPLLIKGTFEPLSKWPTTGLKTVGCWRTFKELLDVAKTKYSGLIFDPTE